VRRSRTLVRIIVAAGLLGGCQPAPQTLRTGILGTDIGMGTPSTLIELAQGIGGEQEPIPATGRQSDGAIAEVKIRGDSWAEGRLGVIAQQFDAWCKRSGGRPDIGANIPRSAGGGGYQPGIARACVLPGGDAAAMISDVFLGDDFRWYSYSFYDPDGLKIYVARFQEAARKRAAETDQAAKNAAARRLVEAARKAERDRVFQAGMKPGDQSDQGLIIEVKRPLALVQKCLATASRTGERPECTNATTLWVPVDTLGSAS
jgi:hypothetical protein